MAKWIIHILTFFSMSVHAQNTGGWVSDSASYRVLEQIIITASRRPESLKSAPVSIINVSGEHLRSYSTFNMIDGLQGIRGVHLITPSLGFKVINSRGFANTTNVRFVQLVDGMDVQSPHIGSPIANALGPTELDIKNAEFVTGMSSALYGMNAINGLIAFQSKNPFESPGLSFQQRSGFNHLGNETMGPRFFTETSIRYAHLFSNRLAFKSDLSLIQGMDWQADDATDLAGGLNQSTGLVNDYNPSRDPVNSYGNESPNRRNMILGGRSYWIARTGYDEKDVVDYRMRQLKWGGSLHYKTKFGNEWRIYGRFALLNNIYQRSNRFKLDDYILQQYGLNYTSPAFQLRIYTNSENSGRSYNLRSMAENMDRYAKSDGAWFSEYANTYESLFRSGTESAVAHAQARKTADGGRLIPGSSSFKDFFSKLRQINDWDSGAALSVRASFIHAEWTFSLTEKWLRSFAARSRSEILAGGDHRTYLIQPDGNYFINPQRGKEGSLLLYGRSGFFISTITRLLNERLSLGFVLRADKYDYFNIRVNPRITLVYSPVQSQSFRIMYQSGYRYPSIFEAFSNINSGGVKRIGGLPVMSNGIFERSWLQNAISLFQSAVIQDMNQGGISKDAAIRKNQALLQQSPYTYLQPEYVRSLELGYQAAFNEGRFVIQGDIYFNRYRDFIAQVNVRVPKTENTDSIPFALFDKVGSSPYRLWTNSRTQVTNWGGSLGISWKNKKGTTMHSNINFARLIRQQVSDGLEDGFNTSPFIFNATFRQADILRCFSIAAAFHWQKRFYWQSFLVDGYVPSYSTVDIVLGVRMPTFPVWNFRIAASNAFNRYYVSYLGGPRIGGIYSFTATYNIFD
jgi:iron complex outermembrane receptor protein